MSSIKIKEILVGDICNQIDFVVDYVLNQPFCNIVVYIKKGPDEIVKRAIIKIEGSEFDNWTGSDNYIQDLILQKLGFERE